MSDVCNHCQGCEDLTGAELHIINSNHYTEKNKETAGLQDSVEWDVVSINDSCLCKDVDLFPIKKVLV